MSRLYLFNHIDILKRELPFIADEGDCGFVLDIQTDFLMTPDYSPQMLPCKFSLKNNSEIIYILKSNQVVEAYTSINLQSKESIYVEFSGFTEICCYCPIRNYKNMIINLHDLFDGYLFNFDCLAVLPLTIYSESNSDSIDKTIDFTENGWLSNENILQHINCSYLNYNLYHYLKSMYDLELNATDLASFSILYDVTERIQQCPLNLLLDKLGNINASKMNSGFFNLLMLKEYDFIDIYEFKNVSYVRKNCDFNNIYKALLMAFPKNKNQYAIEDILELLNLAKTLNCKNFKIRVNKIFNQSVFNKTDKELFEAVNCKIKQIKNKK